jgi:hypothetical protein
MQWKSPVCSGSPQYTLAVASIQWKSVVCSGSPQYTVAVPSIQWQSPVCSDGTQYEVAVPSAQWQSPLYTGSPQYAVAVRSMHWQYPVCSGSPQCTVAVPSMQWQAAVYNVYQKPFSCSTVTPCWETDREIRRRWQAFFVTVLRTRLKITKVFHDNRFTAGPRTRHFCNISCRLALLKPAHYPYSALTCWHNGQQTRQHG